MSVESRSRSDAVPQDIQQVGIGASEEQGYSLNLGSGVVSVARVYEVHTIATGNGSVVELEARLARSSAAAGGY